MKFSLFPMGPRWRRWIGFGVLAASCLSGSAWAARPFSFAEVEAQARKLASQEWRPPPGEAPHALRALDHEAYQEIRYRPEQSLWHGSSRPPFELMFYPTGRQFHEDVRLREIAPDGSVRTLAFDAKAFDFGRHRFSAKDLEGVGLAGWRLHAPLNRKDVRDEVISFLGASYFRGLGRGQRYGSSARGLAVDTAEARGEQFPRFTDFWIQRPGTDARSLNAYALLDSPAATGAYRFVIEPGPSTVVTVQARLFLRDREAKLGLAPLTSMYTFGENQPGRNDYRPEVHDADGLQIHTGEGEWIWRPLVNPKRLLVTSFGTRAPRGFGLMQRDRSFSSYQDLQARYELRPSAWVEPLGDWGEGRVELVQIPSPDETNDNVVAYWVPRQVPTRGPLELNYRLHWQMEKEVRPASAWVTQSRVGRGYVRQPDGTVQFVVDFEGPALKGLKGDAPLKAEVHVGAPSALVAQELTPNEATDGWRLSLRYKPGDPAQPTEIRARLRLRNEIASETWSYIVPAEPDKP